MQYLYFCILEDITNHEDLQSIIPYRKIFTFQPKKQLINELLHPWIQLSTEQLEEKKWDGAPFIEEATRGIEKFEVECEMWLVMDGGYEISSA